MSKRGENIYKRKDGRWEGRYPRGRKQDGALYYGYVYARSYKKVKEEVTLLRAHYALKECDNQQLYQGTTQEWIGHWLEEVVVHRVKPSTYVSYLTKLRRHFIPVFGEYSLHLITSQMLEEWVISLKEELAVSTIHVLFRIIKGCFGQAKKQGVILTDPTRTVSLPMLPIRRPLAFSVLEQKKLAHYCQNDFKSLPVVIALETGMRVGEICGLKWQDIDFGQKLIHVSRTVQRLTDYSQAKLKTYLEIGTPKTLRSERTLPLSENLKRILLRHQIKGESQYVLSKATQPLDPRTVTYRFAQLKERLNLPNYSFHTLRHTFATRCVELGINIAAISSLLGHASIKMTLDVYTSSFMTDQRQAVEKLATL